MLKLILILHFMLVAASTEPLQTSGSKYLDHNTADNDKSVTNNDDTDTQSSLPTIVPSEDILIDIPEKSMRMMTVLQCCLVVLLLMLFLMLVSDWTDLSVLLQTSRHHMVIIEM